MNLADHHALSIRIVAVHEPPEAPVDAVHVRVGLAVDVQESVVRTVRLVGVRPGVGVGRIVPQLRILHHEVRHVHPKAVHPAVHPKPEGIGHRLLDVRVAPVEVGLLLQERMQVVLSRRMVELPRRAAEDAQPVVRRPTVRRRVAPDVPVPLGVVARGSRLHEPRVPVRAVVRHEVDDQLQPAPVHLGYQPVEVGQRPEARIDVGVVGHVVPEVGHRRRVEGREPEGIDRERIGEVVEPVEDVAEVADAVAGAVLEAAGVDLIDDAGMPPGQGRDVGMRHGVAVSGQRSAVSGQRSSCWTTTSVSTRKG